nr:class II heat shock protein [Tanacetum cinerariifolium]
RNLFVSHITEARFEAIANKDKATAGKEQSIKKTTQTIISLRSEVASPEFKGSLDVDEDIGIDDPSSEIDSVFVIGESDVESMEVPRKFGEFLKNKESLSEEFMIRVLKGRDVSDEKSREVFNVTP